MPKLYHLTSFNQLKVSFKSISLQICSLFSTWWRKPNAQNAFKHVFIPKIQLNLNYYSLQVEQTPNYIEFNYCINPILLLNSNECCIYLDVNSYNTKFIYFYTILLLIDNRIHEQRTYTKASKTTKNSFNSTHFPKLEMLTI